MRRLVASIALVLSTSLMSGCATLLAAGPSRVDVRVEGPTDGAVVTLRGETNDEVIRRQDRHFQITLARDSSYAVHVVADGYEPRIASLRSERHPLYYLNFLPEAIGIIGSNYLTGSASNTLLLGGILISLAALMVDESTKSGRRHVAQALVIPMRKREAEQ